jgi:putative oxidoreductase
MQWLFRTSDDQWALTILRITLGIVYLPHGAQKLLGWFGGRGFSETIRLYGQLYHLPAPVVFLVICAEFFGALGLIFGFLTKFDAFAIGLDMAGAIKFVTLQNGFFMNWTGKQHGEGVEFQLLVIGMAIALMIGGAGPLSLDGLLYRHFQRAGARPLPEARERLA